MLSIFTSQFWMPERFYDWSTWKTCSNFEHLASYPLWKSINKSQRHQKHKNFVEWGCSKSEFFFYLWDMYYKYIFMKLIDSHLNTHRCTQKILGGVCITLFTLRRLVSYICFKDCHLDEWFFNHKKWWILLFATSKNQRLHNCKLLVKNIAHTDFISQYLNDFEHYTWVPDYCSFH